MTFYRYITITLLLFFLFSCYTPTKLNGNTLDQEEAAEQGISTPTLVIFLAEVSTVLGGSFTLDVYAMEVVNNAGSYIQISYDKTKLSLLSLNQGDFYAVTPELWFYYDDDAEAGLIDIYSGFLGVDAAAVSYTNLTRSTIVRVGVGGVGGG